MRKRNKVPKNTPDTPKSDQGYYEGERLANLLRLLNREIESTKVLAEKFWFKQQFSIRVNEVTRVLERMMLPAAEIGSSDDQKPSSIRIQAVLVAADCVPKWLTRYLPNLAASRKVPLIFVKDKKGGSLRLGVLSPSSKPINIKKLNPKSPHLQQQLTLLECMINA